VTAKRRIEVKSLNMKLALSAVAIAMLATPALAARSHTQVAPRPMYDTYQGGPSAQVETYPNGAARTGTAESVQSGAEFNLQERGIN
jgi:hypothetical protein